MKLGFVFLILGLSPCAFAQPSVTTACDTAKVIEEFTSAAYDYWLSMPVDEPNHCGPNGWSCDYHKFENTVFVSSRYSGFDASFLATSVSKSASSFWLGFPMAGNLPIEPTGLNIAQKNGQTLISVFQRQVTAATCTENETPTCFYGEFKNCTLKKVILSADSNTDSFEYELSVIKMNDKDGHSKRWFGYSTMEKAFGDSVSEEFKLTTQF